MDSSSVGTGVSAWIPSTNTSTQLQPELRQRIETIADSFMQDPNDSFIESNIETAGGTALLNNNSGRVNRSVDTLPPPQQFDAFAAFDPVKLRIDQSFLNHGVAKKLLTTIPIRKPNKQDFFRVHPSENYRLPAAFIELKDDRETYLVLPEFAPQLSESEYFAAILYLCINRQKVLSFWPVKLPGPDGRQLAWHTTAADAAELAMTNWIRMTANMSLGAYEIYQAQGDIPEPEWPTESFSELLSIGFKGRIIENSEHPVMQKLRGLI
jgi:hypothetical protein